MTRWLYYLYLKLFVVKYKYGSFIILAIIFQSCAGIFGKYAGLSLHNTSLMGLVSNPLYILFLGCLFLQVLVWQQVLIHYSLSFAYPFMSLVYFIILAASVIIFNEGITIANIIGIILIVGGITVLFLIKGESTCNSL